MATIYYSEKAEKDLTEIWEYVAKDSQERANDFMAKLFDAIATLEVFPESGTSPIFPELVQLNVRIFAYKGYLAFYRYNKEADTVNVIHVVNGKMQYRHLFS